jgi:NTE family protein
VSLESAKIENLVFEGGGVRGIAYAGALSALEERSLLGTIQGVAGTSAGAFAALMLSLGHTPAELAETLKALHFKTLEDKPNPLRVPTHYGLYKGEVLYNWIVDQLSRNDLPEALTFEDLVNRGHKDLRVFATDLNICDTREFSAAQTPKASVAGAVRASMSIPLMYAAWQFPDGIPNNHVYVDGGTVYNYPINAFDTGGKASDKTLGFCFHRQATENTPSELGPDHLFAYTKSLFSAILKAQTIGFNQDIEAQGRSVIIDDLGYKATDLELSDEGFDSLFKAGQTAAQQFLNHRERTLSHSTQ